MPVTFNMPVYPLLRKVDVQDAFNDCVSLSDTDPQQMAGSLNLTSMAASLAIQTQQLTVTGNALFSSTSAIGLPVGTTFERPNLPLFGQIRANSDAGTIEVYLQNGKWATVQTSAASTTAVNPPVTLNGPSFGQATGNAIPVTWVQPSGGTAPYTYSLQYRLAGTANWQVWAQQLTTTNATVSGLLPAARYEFLLTAYNAAGSVAAPIAATNTLGYLPGGPTNLAASMPTSTSISLSWTAVNSNQPIAYQPQYALQGASQWTDFGDPIMETNTTVTGLAANSTYNFQIVAKTLGSSYESLAVSSATTPTASVAPNSASNLVFSNIDTSSANLSWQPPSAGTQPMIYQPQYQLAGTTTWNNYGPATTASTILMTDLDSGSAYSIRIVSTNSAGSSTSAVGSFNTLSATASVGTVAGNQNSGATTPIISGPAVANVANGSALPITGITVEDAASCFASGTLALTVSCGSGQITMTDSSGSQIVGSGTNSISMNSTLSGVMTALKSLTYTATKVGTDDITISLTDQNIQKSTLIIVVTISAASGTTSPSPPPGSTGSPSTTQTGQPTDTSGVSANRIRDFLDGFGVNVRFEDPGYNANGGYTLSQAANIENLINYLGGGHIKTLREASGTNLNPTWLAQIAQNCNAKYLLPIDWIVAPSYYQTTLNIMANFASTYPTYVMGLEGQYGAEINNNLAAAAQFQPTLYSEAHSLGLPAFQMAPTTDTDYNPSAFGTPPADIANTICYPYYSPNGDTLSSVGGSNGYLNAMIQNSKVPTPNVPVSICAFGWQSFPDNSTPPTGTGFVSQTVQASYLLEFIFSAYKLGAKYYIYSELMDVAQGLSYEDSGDQYGLIDINGTPKVAAVALHNMYQLLFDSDVSATTFTPGKLNYTVSNKPSPYGGFVNTGYWDALFQKSNGDFWLVMCNEQALNTVGGTNAPLTVGNTTVTLTFGTAKSQINVYDPLLGLTAVTGKSSASSISISLPPHPLLIQIIN